MNINNSEACPGFQWPRHTVAVATARGVHDVASNNTYEPFAVLLAAQRTVFSKQQSGSHNVTIVNICQIQYTLFYQVVIGEL